MSERNHIDNNDKKASNLTCWALLEGKGAAEPLSSDSKEGHVDVYATDGLLGEFDTWRLRELTRIKKDNEAEIACEQESEDVE